VRFYKYAAPTALKKDAWRQEWFGAGLKLAPGIGFQRETGQAANQAVQ
jgi:coproporphyrinogen III oxidase